MKLQISEIAKLTGVSVRTLHYYDEIGLLKPAEVNTNTGYRYYDEVSVEKLKKILYYREMDIPLKEISKLMAKKDGFINDKLLERRKMLQDKKKQIELLIAGIDENLASPVELNGWFDKILQDYNYSGFSYMSDEIETFVVWGKADYEKDKPFSLTGRYPIGSMTKQFTAVCALLLEEQGLLDTEAYIGTYLPECPYGDQIKIVHLLNMTSGLSCQLFEERFAAKLNSLCLQPNANISDKLWVNTWHRVDSMFSRKKSREELLEIMHYAPLKFTPGEAVDFIGMNYEILGYILEQISGKSIDELLDELIFTPLEMHNTSYEGNVDVIGYVDEIPIQYAPAHDGSWGIITTAEDLIKWCEALLDRKLLSEKGYEKLLAPNDFDFAFGWNISGKEHVFSCSISEVHSEVRINFEKGSYYISVRNKAPLPEHNERVMYFPIKSCDDGIVKLEAWEMDTDTYVKVKNIKVYDKDAKELYSMTTSENEYLLFVENHGEKRLAGSFIFDDSYFVELDLSKVLGDRFDKNAVYIIEVRAECDNGQASQLGVKYLKEGKIECMGCYIFFNYEQPYELFMEALERVMEGIRENSDPKQL